MLAAVNSQTIVAYLKLMRLNKPIGWLLLLWPTLWALWIASSGIPTFKLIFIFVTGVLLTRSAGCIVNDFADQHVDAAVKRTINRPLVTGSVSNVQALTLAGILFLTAFFLVLQLNLFTVLLSVAGLLLAIIYPYLKRVTHLPQLWLGVGRA